MLRERLEQVHRRIRAAVERAGRPPSSVMLVGVTKGIPLELIQEAVGLGLTELGENRVQEGRWKFQSIRGVRWHLVGHLQRNKAKDAVELFEVIHAVDSQPLAENLERHLAKRADGGTPNTVEVFVQVNVSEEATKFGCSPAEAPALAKAVSQLPHLRLRGVMTIPPLTDDAEQARPYFRQLRILRDEIQAQLSSSALLLSMGMSHDFEVAIEEGADVVRIGTAIFGPRIQLT